MPRFWDGMRTLDWFRMLSRNGFKIELGRIPMAFIITWLGPTHSVLSLLQSAIHGKRIRESQPTQPPVFIVGHWRSGTTFLHELMMLDDRNSCPTTYECFAPHHCLLTSGIVRTLFPWLLPANRPMDRVQIGWDKPQEDEFALLSLGAGSPYMRMAFPTATHQFLQYLDFEGVPEDEMAKWDATMKYFVQLMAYRRPGRIVLKSPPHTARIARLAKLFPDARFIHIAREPSALVKSTMNLWKTLDEDQCLHHGTAELRKEYVFTAFERMYHAFDKQSAALPPERIAYIRYEELAAEPEKVLAETYKTLDLGDFEVFRPKLAAHLAAQPPYEPNRFKALDPRLQEEMVRRWKFYFERFGYPLPSGG